MYEVNVNRFEWNQFLLVVWMLLHCLSFESEEEVEEEENTNSVDYFRLFAMSSFNEKNSSDLPVFTEWNTRISFEQTNCWPIS